MKVKKSYTTLKKIKKENFDNEEKENLNNEVIQEALKWVNKNKGLAITNEKEYYTSPRISSEVMDCSMPMTFDSYNYCSLGCMYCFAYFFKSNNPSIKGVTLKSVNTSDLISGIEGKPKSARAKLMYKHFYSKKFLLHWGGLADPFCNFENQNGKGFELIPALGEMNYPTLFSFKGRTILKKKYLSLFEKYSKQKNFAFQVSIITNSDNLSKMVEIGVPSTTKRLETIKILSDMGYYTILRLRPFIIGISDEGLSELLSRALEAGIKGVSMEFFALDGRANLGMKERYLWLSKFIGTKDLMEYFSVLSPKERGGYMRLNRLVKEPYIKEVYSFCINHGLVFGCSDPDFKELNTSGSCCGMPDKYKENPLLENWTRNQLTYHLKELRKTYHKTGIKENLYFNETFKSDSTYLDDIILAGDHIAHAGMCNTERFQSSIRTILQKHWNNLNSYANPRNYFNGKILPSGLDNEGNLFYKYHEHEYEKRWKEEGINLTT